MRAARGRVASTIAHNPIIAPVERTSVNRSELKPVCSITFTTGAFTAKSVAATATIRYPTAARLTARTYLFERRASLRGSGRGAAW